MVIVFVKPSGVVTVSVVLGISFEVVVYASLGATLVLTDSCGAKTFPSVSL